MIYWISFYINLKLNKISVIRIMKCVSSELLLKNNSNPEIAIQEVGRRLNKLMVKYAFYNT